MKEIVFIVVSLSIFAVSAFGQNRVILESNGISKVFGGSNAFQDAYEVAVNGDIIYLPGMQFTPPAAIDKSITLYGAGYHADHTQATGLTKLTRNVLTIGVNAAGSHFEGIYFDGNVSFANARIDNVIIKRCYIGGNLTLNGLAEDFSENIKISENIITGSFNGIRTANLVFNNNIIINNTYDIFINLSNNAWIHNNIIVGRGLLVTSNWTSRFVIRNISGSLFENNIIYNTHTSSYTFTEVSNNTFNNNVFSYDPTGDETNNWSDNFTGVTIEEMFENYTGHAYSFEADYKLVNPAIFIGTTGNQVGIYGGLQPFKANTRPSNPQIINKNIANSTNEEGKLEVEIEVEAQNN